MASNPALEPIQPPPKGQVSNFINPSSIAVQMNVANAVCCPISAIAIILRIYTRRWLVGKVSLDDYLLLIGGLFAYASSAGMYVETRYGLGRHSWDVPVSLYLPTLPKLWIADAMTYSAAMLFVKLSFLFLYRRLFFTTGTGFIRQWWVVFMFVFGYSVGGMFSSLLSCIPISMSWDSTVKGHCINLAAFYIANACLNILTDLSILALPIPVILRTSFSLKQKAMLCIVFGTGSFTCVVSAIRIKYTIDYLNLDKVDITRALGPLTMWTIIEMHCAIICACAATLKPFVQRYLVPLLTGHSSSRGTKFVGDIVGGSGSDGRSPLHHKRTRLLTPKPSPFRWRKPDTLVSEEVVLGKLSAKDTLRNSWYKSGHGNWTANCEAEPRSTSKESILQQRGDFSSQAERGSNDVQVVTTMEISYGEAEQLANTVP